MNKEEMDEMWQQAITTANINGDPAVRYAFANLVLESASKECESLEYAFKAGHECAEVIRSMKV